MESSESVRAKLELILKQKDNNRKICPLSTIVKMDRSENRTIHNYSLDTLVDLPPR